MDLIAKTVALAKRIDLAQNSAVLAATLQSCASLSNLLRHAIRTTFRVLKHEPTWKDMPDAEKSRRRGAVEQFYLSRVTVDDLDWSTCPDNVFIDGPLKD